MAKSTMGIVLAIMLAADGSAESQEWPTRSVTMVVPFAAGGPTDAEARMLAPHLGAFLHQTVVVENIAGAGGMIGSARVSKAAPDGYQFVLGGRNTHVYNQILYKKPLYDAVMDFAPVAMVSRNSFVLVTRKDLPVETLPQFISHVQKNQSKLQFGSAGAGSATHISCVMLNQAISVTVTHVPYRSGGQALQDLIGGRIDYMCDAISNSLAQIQAGNVQPIAVLRPERSPVLPKLATSNEQGLANLDTDGWDALFLPNRTPAAIIQRLAKAASDALETPALRQRYLEVGLRVPAPQERSPEYLAKLLPAEMARWAGPIKASGVLMD
jgi:tripartite-type tricarboxylate transporter receptor subunit TctC